jgi:hypothetical protein
MGENDGKFGELGRDLSFILYFYEVFLNEIFIGSY